MHFESFLAAGRPDPKTRRARRRALALALGVHAVMLAGAVVHAGWKVDELSPPPGPTVTLHLPPTPPPPAGAPKADPPRKVTKRIVTRELVQPAERPTSPEVVQQEIGPPSEHPGDPGTGPGRGDKGPPCEGASCDGPPPFLGPEVSMGRLAIDPQAEAYRVKLPPALSRAGMRHWVLAKLCMRADGSVERVSLLRGADPALDPLVVATLQTWRYRPYSVNGRPVPFCTNVRYEMATQ
jgi:periplasmic protein TonB